MQASYTAREREKQLEALAPFRAIAFENLKTMRKQRIDERTEVLTK